MELSKRLQAVAALIEDGDIIADIGTDHAYIPIDLIRRRKIPHAIAMDIHEGPLARAAAHICAAGLDSQIELRLSDGFEKLSPGEADCAVLAGMGGGLTVRILSAHPAVTCSLERCILQPQSEIAKVRAFLLRKGFFILEEEMVCEDGKYYPMMKVVPPRKWDAKQDSPTWNRVHLRFGKLLLEQRNPVLRQLLQRDLGVTEDILKNLPTDGGERTQRRRAELEQDRNEIQEGLRYYEV